MKSQPFYEIDGFYVFPLKQIKIGDSKKIVNSKLGNPKVIKKQDYIQPSRIKLTSMPAFDEQWGYLEGLGNSWVFFKNGKVVAAFREESDW